MFLFVLILFSGLPTQSKCSTFKGTRTRAAVVFIIGFWMLDLANNTVQVGFLNEFVWSKVANEKSYANNQHFHYLQGPARALLADLSGEFLLVSSVSIPSS